MTATKTIRYLIARGVLFTSLASGQAAPVAPVAPAKPCVTTAPAHKPNWFERKARALACKKDKSLCDLPSSVTDATGETAKPNTAPCPVPSPSKAVPASSAPEPPAQ